MLLQQPYIKDWFRARNIRGDESRTNLAKISHTQIKVTVVYNKLSTALLILVHAIE